MTDNMIDKLETIRADIRKSKNDLEKVASLPPSKKDWERMVSVFVDESARDFESHLCFGYKGDHPYSLKQTSSHYPFEFACWLTPDAVKERLNAVKVDRSSSATNKKMTDTRAKLRQLEEAEERLITDIEAQTGEVIHRRADANPAIVLGVFAE